MINYDVHYTNRPDDSVCMVLPDGMVDVWMRKDIQEQEIIGDDGSKYIDYSAVEAYAKFNYSPEITEDNFEEMFDIIANWENDDSDPDDPDVDRDLRIMQIRADLDYIAMEVGIEL